MTNYTFEKLRQIDTLIAERLGHQVSRDNNPCMRSPVTNNSESLTWTGTNVVLPYTTDLNAAIELWSTYWTLEQSFITDAWGILHADNNDIYLAEANSPALVICVARFPDLF